MTKAAHIFRPADTQKKLMPSGAVGGYEKGYFTSLIREHNWPPGFVSKVSLGIHSSVFAAGPQDARERGVGWEANPIGLPGTLPRRVVADASGVSK